MALEFQCKKVGVTDCNHKAVADTAEELLEKIAAHADSKHEVKLNQTLVDYALTTVVETG
jgi:predicted small metal-binding protein